MKQHHYELGKIKITAEYTGFGIPEFWGEDEERPEYRIILKAGTRRYQTRAWGNLASAPDKQAHSLVGMVLEECMRDPGSFEDFCSEYGYDVDSRKAEQAHRQLEKAYAGGAWENEAGIELLEAWRESGDDLEKFVKLTQ